MNGVNVWTRIHSSSRPLELPEAREEENGMDPESEMEAQSKFEWQEPTNITHSLTHSTQLNSTSKFSVERKVECKWHNQGRHLLEQKWMERKNQDRKGKDRISFSKFETTFCSSSFSLSFVAV